MLLEIDTAVSSYYQYVTCEEPFLHTLELGHLILKYPFLASITSCRETQISSSKRRIQKFGNNS